MFQRPLTIDCEGFFVDDEGTFYNAYKNFYYSKSMEKGKKDKAVLLSDGFALAAKKSIDRKLFDEGLNQIEDAKIKLNGYIGYVKNKKKS